MSYLSVKTQQTYTFTVNSKFVFNVALLVIMIGLVTENVKLP